MFSFSFFPPSPTHPYIDNLFSHFSSSFSLLFLRRRLSPPRRTFAFFPSYYHNEEFEILPRTRFFSRCSTITLSATSRCLIFSRILLKYSLFRSFALLERFHPWSVFALIQSLSRLSTPFFLSFRHDVTISRYHIADDHSTRRSSPRILSKFLFAIRDTFGRSRGRER